MTTTSQSKTEPGVTHSDMKTWIRPKDLLKHIYVGEPQIPTHTHTKEQYALEDMLVNHNRSLIQICITLVYLEMKIKGSLGFCKSEYKSGIWISIRAIEYSWVFESWLAYDCYPWPRKSLTVLTSHLWWHHVGSGDKGRRLENPNIPKVFVTNHWLPEVLWRLFV